MRMILTLGIPTLAAWTEDVRLAQIMLVCLSAAPSLFSSAESVTDASRSYLLRAILQHTNPHFHETSKRAETTVNVPYRLDCCPAETHLIHPRGGISRDGKLLEIYRDYRTVQKFYQTSCRQEVVNRPCPLIDAKIQHASRCVQKYSYVYAFVRDFNVSGSFRLDYIRLKSGCSCEMEFSYPEVIDVQ